jgi:hypothetical protein
MSCAVNDNCETSFWLMGIPVADKKVKLFLRFSVSLPAVPSVAPRQRLRPN